MFTETFTYNTWYATSSWLTAHSSQQVSRMYDPYTSMFLSPDNYIQAPDNSQSFNRYAYCLNNPIKYTDPSGEFWHIIAGAAIGGSMNLIMNWSKCEQWYDFASYFAIGAVAGGLSAGVGAGVSSAIAGGGFAAGFTGSQAAGIAVSSFYSGAAIGGASGLSLGFILGTGNSWMGGSSLGNGLIDGMRTGLLSGVGGAMIGGIISGFDAVKDGRNFFTGNKLVDKYLIQYPTGYEFAQETDSHDCAPSVTKIIEKYKGNDISVKQIRDLYAPGTTSMDNVEDIYYWMNYDNKYEMSSSNINGIDMNVIYNRFSGGKHVPLSIKVEDDYHTVLINRMEMWQCYPWGKQYQPSMNYKTWVIDPMTGFSRRLYEKIINAFFIK